MSLTHRTLHLLPILLGSSLLLPRLAAQSSAPQDPGPAGNPTAPRSGPIRVSGGVMASLLLDHKDPEYPAEARAKHIAGAVVLSAVITAEGKIDTLTAVSGPEILRDAALSAVHDWTYKPYQLNGRPVPVQTTITVRFELGNSPPSGSAS